MIFLSPELPHVMSPNHGPLHKCTHFQKQSQMTKSRCGEGWFLLSSMMENLFQAPFPDPDGCCQYLKLSAYRCVTSASVSVFTWCFLYPNLLLTSPVKSPVTGLRTHHDPIWFHLNYVCNNPTSKKGHMPEVRTWVSERPNQPTIPSHHQLRQRFHKTWMV